VRLRHEFALFLLGGGLGLLIDAAVVQALVRLAGEDPYLARLPSFLLAASFTWWWNRRWTFAGRSSGHAARGEWLRWILLMGLGAVLNYAVYAVALGLFPALLAWPALAVAAGSAAGALVNFALARRVLFRHPGNIA